MRLALLALILGSSLSLAAVADDDAEADAVLASALDLFDQAISEPNPEVRLTMLDSVRRRLDSIVEDYPATDLAWRIAIGEPIGWLDASALDAAYEDACLQALIVDCVLTLAVRSAERILAEEDGLVEIARTARWLKALSLYPAPTDAFDHVLRHTGVHLSDFSDDQLHHIVRFRAFAGDVEGAIEAADFMRSSDERDATFDGALFDVLVLPADEAYRWQTGSGGVRLAMESALSLANRIEAPDQRLEMLGNVARSLGVGEPYLALKQAQQELAQEEEGGGGDGSQPIDAPSTDETPADEEPDREAASSLKATWIWSSMLRNDARDWALSRESTSEAKLVSFAEGLHSWLDTHADVEPVFLRRRIIGDVAVAFAYLGRTVEAFQLVSQLPSGREYPFSERRSPRVDTAVAVVQLGGGRESIAELADSYGSADGQASFIRRVAFQLARDGYMAPAEDLIDLAEVVTRSIGDDDDRNFGLGSLARVLIKMGQFDRALSILDMEVYGRPLTRAIGTLMEVRLAQRVRNFLPEQDQIWSSTETSDIRTFAIDTAFVQAFGGDLEGAFLTLDLASEAFVLRDWFGIRSSNLISIANTQAILGDRGRAIATVSLALEAAIRSELEDRRFTTFLDAADILARLPQESAYNG